MTRSATASILKPGAIDALLAPALALGVCQFPGGDSVPEHLRETRLGGAVFLLRICTVVRAWVVPCLAPEQGSRSS